MTWSIGVNRHVLWFKRLNNWWLGTLAQRWFRDFQNFSGTNPVVILGQRILHLYLLSQGLFVMLIRKVVSWIFLKYSETIKDSLSVSCSRRNGMNLEQVQKLNFKRKKVLEYSGTFHLFMSESFCTKHFPRQYRSRQSFKRNSSVSNSAENVIFCPDDDGISNGTPGYLMFY